MIGRNDTCWCGSGKKWKKCHYPKLPNGEPIGKTPQNLADLYKKKFNIFLKNDKEIEGIRASCHLAAKILDATCSIAQAGVTTQELNDYAHQLHLEAGAIPACLHYSHPPFPKSICTSINEVICHGIPDKTKLKEGDIINIDVTCILNGYYGDCSKMVAIGKVNEERRRVMDVSYECLMRSAEITKPGVPISKIGEVIEDYATEHHCSVVNQFVGHGVGIEFHENPQVPFYKNSIGIQMAPGMIFTIEPMINAGVREAIIDEKDEWTARTADGRASAQWEHTILITDKGHEILTPWKR